MERNKRIMRLDFGKYKKKLSSCFNRADGFLDLPKIKKINFGLIIFISFLLIYLFNMLHPLLADDWAYSLMEDGRTRIGNLADVYKSLYSHYFNWGGRIVVHAVAEILLLLDLRLAKIINSVAFLLYTIIIYKIANRTKTIQPSLLLSICLLVFFCQPAFGSAVLWITGSANYLWGTLIVLSFLYPYVNHVFNAKKNDGTIRRLFFFFGGILAGWTNENMAIALIFMLSVFILYYKFRCGKIPVWAITGLLGSLTGASFMILAPGNYARLDIILKEQVVHYSPAGIFLKRFIRPFLGFYRYALPATFAYAIILLLHKSYGKNNHASKTRFISFVFMAGAIVATLPMFASPIFPLRSSFGIISLIIAAACVLYANLDFSTTFIKRLNYIVLFFAFLFFTADYCNGYKVLKEINQHTNSRLDKINKGKSTGITDFIFDDRMAVPQNRFLHYYEITPDSTHSLNQSFAGYHEINSVILK